MITKSGKHHWMATVIHLDANGNETFRKDLVKFTAKDPEKYIANLRNRFTAVGFCSHVWVTTKAENLVDLDA